MRELLTEIFGNFSRLIIFFHIASAMLLVGSLFMMRVIVKPVLDGIESQEERYAKGLELMRRYGYFLLPVMLILISASVFMNVGLGFKYGNPTTYIMIHTKEALWTFIAFNFAYMWFKYRNAVKAYKEQEYIEVHENLILMINYLIPLNFVLGLIAAYFGIILRGF